MFGDTGILFLSNSNGYPDLGISHFVGTLGIVVFTIPFGGAPLVLAPCSELFGRLPVYIVSSAIFWMMFLPQALAKVILSFTV